MATAYLAILYFSLCGSYGGLQRRYSIMVAVSNFSFVYAPYVVTQIIQVWRCSRRYVRIDVIFEVVTNPFHITSWSHERHGFIISSTAYPELQKSLLKLHLIVISVDQPCEMMRGDIF